MCKVSIHILIQQRLILILGSDRVAPDIKNPWSSEERIKMIQYCLT